MIVTYNICDNYVNFGDIDKPCGEVYAGVVGRCPKCGTDAAFATRRLGSMSDFVYDVETYPNAFTMTTIHALTRKVWRHEITSRRHDGVEIVRFLDWLRHKKARMVGFNNCYFDYNVIDFIYNNINAGLLPCHIYDIAMRLIEATKDEQHKLRKWPNERIIEQIDLYKIHHFDNRSKSASLKQLEFAMDAESIKDLPFPVGTHLSYPQIDTLIEYNDWDSFKTLDFYFHSAKMIQFREQFTELHYNDYLNRNDSQIGSDLMIKYLEKADKNSCFKRVGGRKVKKQTVRESIDLGKVILPWIRFQSPEFERIKQFLQRQTIRETKGVFKNLTCVVNGLKYKFTTGGMHASVESTTVRSDKTFKIIDIDVKSFYPNLSIQNNMHPEHLDVEVFKSTYQKLYQLRPSDKLNPLNKAIKLALNTVYGNSNSKYSVFFDSEYTMRTTINGQLLICLLAEQLGNIPDLSVIQVNTDGLTVKVRRDDEETLKAICDHWEHLTGLILEYADYKTMFIKDVNAYIAVYENGDVKRKGAYEYELEWHKDFSKRVVAKAAEAALLHGKSIEEFIKNHKNKFDFCIMMKAKNGARNFQEINGELEELQKVSRYYVTTTGNVMKKGFPVPKGKIRGDFKRKPKISDILYHETLREIGGHFIWDERIHTKNKSVYSPSIEEDCKGWLCTLVDDINDFDWSNINYDYYIQKTRDLVDPLL